MGLAQWQVGNHGRTGGQRAGEADAESAVTNDEESIEQQEDQSEDNDQLHDGHQQDQDHDAEEDY